MNSALIQTEPCRLSPVKKQIYGSWHNPAVTLAALWLVGNLGIQCLCAAQATNIPVRFLISDGKGTVNVEHYQELADRIEFIVDADDCRLHCEVMPRSFRVEPKKSYWVASSYYNPFIIAAQSNAVLAFDLDHPRNCRIIIEPVKGDNLLQNPSFEEAANELPAGWKCQSGHVTNCTQRSGKYSVVLCNADTNSAAELKSALVAVQSGQEYEASAFYNTRDIPYGSSANFVVVVAAKGKPSLYFSCWWLNPLIYGAPDEWRRVFLRFKVPEDYKEESKAGVLVTASGYPFTSYWDDLSLRLAPSMVANDRRLPMIGTAGGYIVHQPIR